MKENGTWVGSHNCDVGDRDELIKAAQEIFGENSVVPVSNFNTLKLKSLVKDISKFYQIPFDEVNAVTGPLEDEVAALSHDPNMEKSMFVLKHEDCMKYSKRYNEFMTKYPQVEDKVKTLFMMNRSVGRHAGGVLICPELEKHMPLITVRGELQTPWTEGVNIRNLEDNGFLKFDFLGLAQMKMVEDCIRRILTKELKRKPRFEEIKKFYDDKINCRYVEPNDMKVFNSVFKEGRWPGIFQFTSCLTGDTQITMANGEVKRIDEVRANDVVVSFNENLQQFEHKVVSDFLDQGKKECVELTLENGSALTCTLDHKFLTSNRGWVEAKDLTDSDDIVEYDYPDIP
jgi:DNA polymerase III alpha subunit